GLLTPALLAAWWGMSGGQIMERGDPSGVSPFIAAEMVGPNAPRTMVISGAANGAVSYRLISGEGSRIGDADVAPPAGTMAEIDAGVARMLAGQGDAAFLADEAIKYVQVRQRDAPRIARQMDAVPGLSRLSTVSGTALWTVSGVRDRADVTAPDVASAQSSILWELPGRALALFALLALVVLASPRLRRRQDSPGLATDDGGERP
ncbi:MAG: hypothetical protein U0904_07085, partial [Candidatus Nanopelagicales bacterium]|nr:hypothetical protein [Candidatus Nanopelagicales bacterium]